MSKDLQTEWNIKPLNKDTHIIIGKPDEIVPTWTVWVDGEIKIECKDPVECWQFIAELSTAVVKELAGKTLKL